MRVGDASPNKASTITGCSHAKLSASRALIRSTADTAKSQEASNQGVVMEMPNPVAIRWNEACGSV